MLNRRRFLRGLLSLPVAAAIVVNDKLGWTLPRVESTEFSAAFMKGRQLGMTMATYNALKVRMREHMNKTSVFDQWFREGEGDG